ncbi:hypothetical protein [Virgibacillus sp. DJP39]|uniref:hypothetical protein n=1 Tax=Virgibacillus sp. DJP39 TaxID=3409790 RepID=UPI003BB4F645
MKSITLEQLLQSGDSNNVLQLKWNLIKWKKQGVIFYKENLCNLDLDQQFELYFYIIKENVDYQDAFPVPKSFFKLQRKVLIDDLKHFYLDYYDQNDIADDTFLLNLKKYIGERYVWFYCDDE